MLHNLAPDADTWGLFGAGGAARSVRKNRTQRPDRSAPPLYTIQPRVPGPTLDVPRRAATRSLNPRGRGRVDERRRGAWRCSAASGAAEPDAEGA